MISWKELKERRITQVVLTYVAVGWVALAGVDQVVDREVLPELFYRLALLVYACGIPVALILGWFHGEKGRQRVTIPEALLLGLVLIFTAGSGVSVVRSYQQEQSAGVPGLDPRRVAVLYFDDVSGSANDMEYIADGLTEALIDELAQVRELDVVSRNGVEPYRGGSTPADSIGRALKAGSVINGSVERQGDQMRVSVRLVDPESGVDMDRTSFTVPADELLAARDSLVSSTARFLRTRVGEELRRRERLAETASVEAWTLVQRAERLRKEADEARQHDADRALMLLAEADSLLRAAEAFDQQWSEPTVIRAQIALNQGVWAHSLDDAVASVNAGIELANRVIERQGTNARAWEARGTLRYFHWYLDASPTREERASLLGAAQSDLERAVSLDGTLAASLARLSRIYNYERGDRIEGALKARQALDADAYLRDAPAILDLLFWAHYDMGQFTQARNTCAEGGVRFPQDFRFKQCGLWMMITPGATPDPDAAWRLLVEADSLTPADRRPFEHSKSEMIVAGVLARVEMADSARMVLDGARAGFEVDPEQSLPGYEAIIRTLLGDYDEAVDRLRRYVSANPDHQFEVEGDLHWWWRPLRDHPGFSSVVSRAP